MRSNAILNIENIDKYCFIWCILASLHPRNNNHPSRVSCYKKYFDELNIQGFDFPNAFKCSDVHKFNELNISSINLFELIFYQDQNKWKHKLKPIKVSKRESNRIVELLFYKNLFALNKKFNVILGDYHEIFICRRCLNSYTSENMLTLQKQKCEYSDLTTIGNSSESHLHWKKIFIRVLYNFGYTQILKLIMKSIFLL